ncbi:ExbD/TolR family protein [Rhodalgimonas zhirmunskyi]|uniref:Biopolymer transporter ExbD n=1 Tax=Rhodalgimonas zhirmunskyi TaxID=2964767 RepID=A0AAJ1U589_9RHOB|nr:biopolymer transporter ExbD [Rhodoalgimonas zhirmunskyi]MDQ2093380.1 biopolymer transporter ExbD [Rhodoalgimonas zhirmunskyi]
MNLGQPTRRPARESVVPMINVVFLLLIFFLMSAQIVPPEPIDVTPPEASVEAPAEGQRILFIAPDGMLAMGDLRGEAVFGGLAAMEDLIAGEPLLIRADKTLEAGKLAALLPRLAEVGVRRVKLVSVAR